MILLLLLQKLQLPRPVHEVVPCRAEGAHLASRRPAPRGCLGAACPAAASGSARSGIPGPILVAASMPGLGGSSGEVVLLVGCKRLRARRDDGVMTRMLSRVEGATASPYSASPSSASSFCIACVSCGRQAGACSRACCTASTSTATASDVVLPALHSAAWCVLRGLTKQVAGLPA